MQCGQKFDRPPGNKGHGRPFLQLRQAGTHPARQASSLNRDETKKKQKKKQTFFFRSSAPVCRHSASSTLVVYTYVGACLFSRQTATRSNGQTDKLLFTAAPRRTRRRPALPTPNSRPKVPKKSVPLRPGINHHRFAHLASKPARIWSSSAYLPL